MNIGRLLDAILWCFIGIGFFVTGLQRQRAAKLAKEEEKKKDTLAPGLTIVGGILAIYGIYLLVRTFV
jgi:hypothetical protein